MAPPPPICFPFIGKKPKRRLSWSPSDRSGASFQQDQVIRHPSFSPTSTLTTQADNLTFHSDSEKYDDVPAHLPEIQLTSKGKPRLIRSNTMTGTKKSTASNKWGYGWGIGKQKEKGKEEDSEREMSEKPESMTSQTNLPLYQPPIRSNSKSTQASRSTQNTQKTEETYASRETRETRDTHRSKSTHHSKSTHQSRPSYHDRPTHRSSPSKNSIPTRQAFPNDSSSTLVGSALDRKINDVDSYKEKTDTSERLAELRALMAKDDLDFYVIPSEDAHQSEYVPSSEKRRQFISGFSGSAGQAIVTKSSAYLITDSRYWIQASTQLDSNWELVKAGSVDGPKDWIEWLLERLKDARVGIDARMISHKNQTLINSKAPALGAKFIYPSQNLIDLIWKGKPERSRDPVYIQPIEYTGKDANYKLSKLRAWIEQQPASVPSYVKTPPTAAQIHVGTLVTSLSAIAYLLNLRGSDIPYNPIFQAYLYVGLDRAIIFLDAHKVTDDVSRYLDGFGVERKDYAYLWTFLRKREWGEGKVLIAPEASYAISLMFTHFRYTIAPSYVEQMMSIKNNVELEGMRRAYARDGASFVQFLAWLESKLYEGYDITEWEAAFRLTEFRRRHKQFMGLAYENISASGPNAALPHYSPRKSTARMIDRETPYLNDSGGQYRDGTCDTTRTVHFGRPTNEQCEAYTRVLQGHIAIDSAVFPEGTSGQQLDVLARKALWKDGLNYMHGTGHGFGSFLNVHEGPQSFSTNIPLVPGHVITNEPGFYNEGKWGMRIESALTVRHVKTKGQFNGDIWLGFERLTCVPIQTRMVKDSMLTKEEKQWLKDHNQRCLDKLTPYLQDDKRAMKWLRREAERGIGLASGPPGMTIEWD